MPLPFGVDAQFTAIGPFGNLVTVLVIPVPSGPNLVIGIANGTAITLSVGSTAGAANIDWNALAALINADPGASALVLVEGSTSTSLGFVGVGRVLPLQGGGYGLGMGQFYTAGVSNPATASCSLTIEKESPSLGAPEGCFELIRVVATMRPARHLPVRGSSG